MQTVVCVLMGGWFGGVCRYACALWMPAPHGVWNSTLMVNLLGCLALGWVQANPMGWLRHPHLRVGTCVGFIGSFTTFSSFCFDVEAGMSTHTGMAGVYLLVSALGGMGAVCVGYGLPFLTRSVVRLARGWTV